MNFLKKLFLVICVVVVVIGIFFISYEKVFKNFYPLKYSEFVSCYAEMFDVNESLIYAVILTESHFDKMAVSNKNATGLMQITEDTFEWLKTKNKNDNDLIYDNMFDPEHNIRYGVMLLSMNLSDFYDIKTALCAYNAGRTAVFTWLGDNSLSDDGLVLNKIPYSETEYYVKKVMTAIEIYKKIYGID